jgi:hypothetical protein
MTAVRAPRSSALLIALGLVAVLAAGPVAAAEVSPSSFPDRSRIDPAALPRGPAVTTLHTEGRSIVDGRVTLRTALTGQLQILGRAESGYLVTTRDDDGSHHTLWRVDTAGFAQRLTALGFDGDDLRVSPGGARVAWTDQRKDSTRVLVVRTTDGTLVDDRRFAGQLRVLDLRKRVLLDGFGPDRTLWWRPGVDTVTVVRGLQLGQADLAADRAVVLVEDRVNGYDGICFGYAALSAPSDLLWKDCADKPLSFSPDRRLVVTTFIEADGPGTGLLQVRSAATDTVRATLRTGGFFVFPYWAGNDAFLAHTWRRGKAAIVRVSRDGTVERVSRVVDERVGDDELRWSFPTS